MWFFFFMLLMKGTLEISKLITYLSTSALKKSNHPAHFFQNFRDAKTHLLAGFDVWMPAMAHYPPGETTASFLSLFPQHSFKFLFYFNV